MEADKTTADKDKTEYCRGLWSLYNSIQVKDTKITSLIQFYSFYTNITN